MRKVERGKVRGAGVFGMQERVASTPRATDWVAAAKLSFREEGLWRDTIPPYEYANSWGAGVCRRPGEWK